jgi:HEAT repeat protein
MMGALNRITAAAAMTVVLSSGPSAQQPAVANGRVTTRPAGAPFSQSFRAMVSSQPETGWIGYTVPVVDRERFMCCGGPGQRSDEISPADGTRQENGTSWNRCRLEPSGTAPPTRESATAPAGAARATVQLEGADRIAVLYRVVEHKVERIRVIAADCPLDAGGRPVAWLEGVKPADSVVLLESLVVEPDATGRLLDGAIMAIALHGEPGADDALERLGQDGRPETVRKKVTFWLGNARGRRGFDRLLTILRDDPSVEVRKSAVFGVSQSSLPDTVDALARIARTDNEPRLRSEALFWLAQKAGRKAAEAITSRIEQDPDTDVKKKAVFALSQLPSGEGVPLLINVARTNTNPAVRKQAMFWLGQSKDPRAIDFFTQVLK